MFDSNIQPTREKSEREFSKKREQIKFIKEFIKNPSKTYGGFTATLHIDYSLCDSEEIKSLDINFLEYTRLGNVIRKCLLALFEANFESEATVDMSSIDEKIMLETLLSDIKIRIEQENYCCPEKTEQYLNFPLFCASNETSIGDKCKLAITPGFRNMLTNLHLL